MKSVWMIACAAALAGMAGMGADGGAQSAAKDPAKETTPASDDPAYVLGFTVNLIDGTPKKLEDYKGKVVVIVNCASKCGFTSQYEGLEKLYKEHKDRGLVVLGFPANNFGSQEPGSNEEIARFCSDKYNVTFPMFEKISVAGPEKHPLYQKLTAQPAPIGGDPKWNFTKFVINREGRVVGRYDAERNNARTSNLEDGLVKQVEGLLAGKV